ncbi:hypothetical protein ACFUJR_34545 [Streptomyces sp. NPDC057271]|uniref:hypothetical protein n=1 Tax=unclassified Streptomyces TaxID=2593676 RepID=UPI00364338F2
MSEDGASTISVQPADVAAFGKFLQECAGEGSDAVPGITSITSLLGTLGISPGDPAVIPHVDELTATFAAVVQTLAEALMLFAKGIGEIGSQLVTVAGEYASAEELAQADVEDLGALLAATDEFMKESGGNVATLRDLTNQLAEQGGAADGDQTGPAATPAN